MSLAPVTTPVYTSPLLSASLETPAKTDALGGSATTGQTATLTVTIKPPGSQTAFTSTVQLEAPDSLTDLAAGIGAACEQLDAQLTTGVFTSYAEVASLLDDFTAALQSGTPLTAEQLGAIEQRADTAVRTLADIVTNSTYPNFTDFLKELIGVAQELRQQASEMKAEAIQGKFDLQMAAADQASIAATENKASRDENIKADRTDAWANLAGTILGAGAGALGVVTNRGDAGGKSATFNMFNQTITSLFSSSSKVSTSADRLDASDHKGKADAADVATQRLNAQAGLKDADISRFEDLRNSMGALRDMLLRMQPDLISSAMAALRAANTA
jgi:hypothetical protein